MTRRVIATLAVVALSASSAAAQSAGTYTPARTADGQPDLQGMWTNNSATPFERPRAFREKASLTDEELATLQERLAEIREGTQAGDLLGDFLIQKVLDDPEFRGFDQRTGNYNSFWLVDRELDNRTSLVVDPPNGRIPPITPEARQRRRAARGGFGSSSPDGPEDLTLSVRCITYGVPNLLAGYNSYFQILQSPEYVVILQELIHDARVIPLDGRPHLADGIRQWHGDSRGRWEGDTLVVETSNYSPRTSLRGASENLRVVERFTRVSPEVIEWEITFEDPATWPRPWTAMILLKNSGEAMFEYACHEGNYAMHDILAGARAQEETAQAEQPR